MENTENDKPPSVSSAKTWRALSVFSAAAVLVFAALLYKAIEARFSPAPQPQAEQLAQQPSPFQTIASSAPAPAPSIDKPAEPTSALLRQELTPSTTVAALSVPQEETEEQEPDAEPAPEETLPQQPQAESSAPPATETTAKPKARKVRFVYTGKTNDSVFLSGTFISWKKTAMKRINGKWVAELYMGPGTYRYCFIVNGVKKPDPLQPLRQGGYSLAVVR